MIIRKLSTETGLSVSYLRKLANTASHRYKTYTIKKRTGGSRKIDHPARELKLVQSWIAENVFSSVPVHESVYSYRKGRGIVNNANVHRDKNYLMRIDFADFFPSIKKRDVIRFLTERRRSGRVKMSDSDIRFIADCVLKGDSLTIGAPSSPVISNVLLFDFDHKVSSACRERKVEYTRYADDLYFSTDVPNVLSDVLVEVEQSIKNIDYPKVRINRNKTVFTSRKRERKVTGLVLTSDKKISIGRTKKRMIKSMIFKFLHGQLERREASYLRGYVSFVKSVEPVFVKALAKKFGEDVLAKIEKIELVSRK